MKVEINMFSSLSKCKRFVDNFIKNKDMINIKIIPLQGEKGIAYFACMSYQ